MVGKDEAQDSVVDAGHRRENGGISVVRVGGDWPFEGKYGAYVGMHGGRGT